jgi:hypothetical protein
VDWGVFNQVNQSQQGEENAQNTMGWLKKQ